MSVAYSPIGRECRISRFDQRDSRILYDPDFDYYENLVGKRATDDSTYIYFDPPIPSVLFRLPCTLDQLPGPAKVVTTSLLFPASSKNGKHTVHLDLTAQGKDGKGKTFLEEYVPPHKSYQPPNPVEKAPRREQEEVYLPPQVPPPVSSLLPRTPDLLYNTPEIDKGKKTACVRSMHVWFSWPGLFFCFEAGCGGLIILVSFVDYS